MGKVSAFDINTIDSRIRELVAYARERDGEDRTALFRNLVDLFLTAKAPTRQPTRGQLLDVIEALVPHVDTESRRTAAALVASMSKPPLDLALRLCRDRASLVADLLKNVPFEEDDVIDLITATGREHHQILATRSDLSANVWIALARAAPAAPALNTQSTLALWRDDLGAGKLREERQSATVMQLHPDGPADSQKSDGSKSASLRILRTDEDLVAERIAQDDTEIMVGEPDDQAISTPAPTAASRPDSGQGSPVRETKRQQLRDPGPGGWAWRSDRDGLVTDVSPAGTKLLGGLDFVIGSAMLDLLGLNAKLDHPVSRAFQRRGTIHDAPIALDQLDKPHRYWTLDAAPLFSPCGGVFEGYEGALTPVVPSEDDLPLEDDPMFLDDIDSNRRLAPEGFTDQPSVLQSTTAEPKAQTALAAKVNAVLSEVVSKSMDRAALRQDEPERLPDLPPAKPVVQKDPKDAELVATLDILEEAVGRLMAASKSSGNVQMRLQAEIAAACARTLRGQLTD